jgi:hypothetical protein
MGLDILRIQETLFFCDFLSKRTSDLPWTRSKEVTAYQLLDCVPTKQTQVPSPVLALPSFWRKVNKS